MEPSKSQIERVSRALCLAQGVDPDSTAALVTFSYDDKYPNGIMQIGRYEKGWDYKNPKLQPRNPSGTKLWQWFTSDALAAIEALASPEHPA